MDDLCSYTRRGNCSIPGFVKQDAAAFFERKPSNYRKEADKNIQQNQNAMLMDTMKNLHQKFLSENASRVMFYALFCRLKPFWVVRPTNADRESCLCKQHEYLAFVVDKLHEMNILNHRNLETLLESISCEPNKECMYGDCTACKLMNVPLDNTDDADAMVTCTQWGTETREVKKSNENESMSFKITCKTERTVCLHQRT